MKKLTAGIFTMLLGLVAVNADAAITSQAYVDDAIRDVQSAITTNTTNLTNQINTVSGDVEALSDKVDGFIGSDGVDGTVAGLISTAVSAEADRAGAAEQQIAGDLSAEITARENADNAINETIGSTANLQTTDTATIVGAINSLKSATDALSTGTITSDKIGEGAIKTINIENGAVTSEKLGTIGGLDAVTEASVQKITVNDKGQITSAQAAVLSDITNVPTRCSEAGAECVLKYTATGFKWEDISTTYTGPAE